MAPAGRATVDRELTLLRPVPPAILSGKKRDDNIFDRCPAYSVQQLSVLLSKDQTRAVVEKILTSEGPDQELLSFAEALRKPVVICTEHFGNLSLSREFDWFEGKRKWNRRLTDVVFTKSADGSIEDAIKTAETLWADEAGWKQRADDYAVEKLLPLKNASWLEDNDVEVTSNEFKARMKLVSITVEGKGRFTFWHEDGDLFWGHSIEIRGTLEVGLIDADIPG